MSVQQKHNILYNTNTAYPHSAANVTPSPFPFSSASPSAVPFFSHFSPQTYLQRNCTSRLPPVHPKSFVKDSLSSSSRLSPNISFPSSSHFSAAGSSSGVCASPSSKSNSRKETGSHSYAVSSFSPRTSAVLPPSHSSTPVISHVCNTTISAIIPTDIYTAVTSSDSEFDEDEEEKQDKEKYEEKNKPPARERLLFMARVAERLGRFDDMEKYVILTCQRKLKDGVPFSADEKQVLQVALKNSISDRRNAYKLLLNLIEKEIDSTDTYTRQKVSLCQEYSKKLVDELLCHCEKSLNLFKDVLLPTAEDVKSKIFYMKMSADYMRYLSEFTTALTQFRHLQNAQKMYSQAMYIASKELQPYDSIRLSLSLNWAVFNCDILADKKKALKIAKDTFNAALDKIELIDDDEYKECAVLLQVIKDNINQWVLDTTDKNSIFII